MLTEYKMGILPIKDLLSSFSGIFIMYKLSPLTSLQLLFWLRKGEVNRKSVYFKVIFRMFLVFCALIRKKRQFVKLMETNP